MYCKYMNMYERVSLCVRAARLGYVVRLRSFV